MEIVWFSLGFLVSWCWDQVTELSTWINAFHVSSKHSSPSHIRTCDSSAVHGRRCIETSVSKLECLLVPIELHFTLYVFMFLGWSNRQS